jgi:hypothetical protein
MPIKKRGRNRGPCNRWQENPPNKVPCITLIKTQNLHKSNMQYTITESADSTSLPLFWHQWNKNCTLTRWSPFVQLVCFPGFFGQWLRSLNSSTDPTPHSNSQKDKEEARSNCKLQSTLNQLKLLTPLGIAESWPVKSQLLQLSHLECNWQNFQHHLQGTAWYFEQTLQV